MSSTLINVFGPPSSGKSTLTAELFTLMKKRGYNCELVTEYAKELVYRENLTEIKDQLKILAEQHYRVKVMVNKVNYIISDASFLSSAVWGKINNSYQDENETFEKLCVMIHNQYSNLNYYIDDTPNIVYNDKTRLPIDVDTYYNIDKKFKQLFEKYNIKVKYCKRIELIDTILSDIVRLNPINNL